MGENGPWTTISMKPGRRTDEEVRKRWETLSIVRGEGIYTKGESVYLSLDEDWEVGEIEEELSLQKLFSFGDRGDEMVVLENKVGEGGMGEVWSAWQEPIGREVAVKKLRDIGQRSLLRKKLLREAKITGMLEHPNIIPIHLLGVTADGTPAFAMKLVQGVSWEDLLSERKEWPTGLQGASKLERHLRILKQVCNAIHFAHSKGVVHRDLKPANVMIGAFGEVYVMDWGLALSLEESADGLPTTSSEKGIFGTPAYMSPEMANGDNAWIDETTDVYLLGAILHELLTGEAPHAGDSLYEVLYSASQSKPQEYGPGVPKELASICWTAMHVDQASRYQDAELFRQALAGFLTHRASHQICLEMSMPLVQLNAYHKSVHELSEDDIQSIYQLFGKVRFGFEQALRMWEDNEQAIKGLQDAMELMIRFELKQRHGRAVSVLLADLPTPNHELKLEYDLLLVELEEERARLDAFEKMHHEIDLSIQSQSRSRLMLLMALLWGVFPLMAEIAHDLSWHVMTAADEMLLSGVGVFGSLLCIWWWRRYLRRNAVNRNLLMALVLTICSLFFLWALSLRIGLELPQILALEAIPMFGFFSYVAVLVDRRLMPVLALYFGVLFAALLYPPIAGYATNVGNTCAFLLLGWIWQMPPEKPLEAVA